MSERPLNAPSHLDDLDLQAQILKACGAQLGEIAWHSFSSDTEILRDSKAHAKSIRSCLDRYKGETLASDFLLLEVGAYAHVTGYLLADELGIDVTLLDISATNLRKGLFLARREGLDADVTRVSADFHELPLPSGSFDMVFVASSVHHSATPQVVLEQMFRVLKTDGLLLLENEPTEREFCFYAFRSNRPDNFTRFEKALEEQGLLHIVSSPFPGSRPEELFGMVENDRIPLDTFLNSFTQFGDIQELTLESCVENLDRELLGRRHDTKEDLKAYLEESFYGGLRATESALTERERLMGMSLPGVAQVEMMVERTVESLKHLPEDGQSELPRAEARLFGAALRAVIRRTDGASNSDAVGKSERPEDRRETIALEDGVWVVPFKHPTLSLEIGAGSIPSVQDASKERLSEFFPSDEWQYLREENGGVSMVNLVPRARLCLPSLAVKALMVVRFYAIASDDGPYRVVFRCGQGSDSHTICQSESRLSRFLMAEKAGDAQVTILDLDDNLLELPMHVRVGVLQVVPVSPIL